MWHTASAKKVDSFIFQANGKLVRKCLCKHTGFLSSPNRLWSSQHFFCHIWFWSLKSCENIMYVSITQFVLFNNLVLWNSSSSNYFNVLLNNVNICWLSCGVLLALSHSMGKSSRDMMNQWHACILLSYFCHRFPICFGRQLFDGHCVWNSIVKRFTFRNDLVQSEFKRRSMADKAKSIMKKPEAIKIERMDVDEAQSYDSDNETGRNRQITIYFINWLFDWKLFMEVFLDVCRTWYARWRRVSSRCARYNFG